MTDQPKLHKTHLGKGVDTTTENIIPVEPLERQELRRLEQKGRTKIEKEFKTLETLKVEYVSIDAIFPNPYNPNRQSDREFELLLSSIAEDGFTQPVLVQHGSNQIIDGEHRWRAMKRLGFETIAVVFADMTEQQARIATLRHNRARGSEDIELSIKILKDLASIGALEHAVDSLGINENEINLLLNAQSAPQQNAGEEFSFAWLPTDAKDEKEPEKDLKDRHVSVSKKAMEEQKAYDGYMEKTGSLIKAGEISKKLNEQLDRITIQFKDLEDISFVQNLLGDRPVEVVIEACATYMFNHKDDGSYGFIYEKWAPLENVTDLIEMRRKK